MSVEQAAEDKTVGFVTVMVAGQRFGVSLTRVDHVFVPDQLSRVPLAPPEIAGLVNLRGHIFTAVDLRARLGLPKREDTAPTIALGVEKAGERYGLVADTAGEAMWVTPSSVERAPSNLDARWADLCSGVCQLDDGLLVLLDVDRVLNFSQSASQREVHRGAPAYEGRV